MTRWKLSRLIFLTLGVAIVPTPSLAGVCEAKSGNTAVALLELYTSEGCNSCPPADRWIAELPKRGFGPDRIVPLAYHVDYWNYLGWRDRFSQAAFTRRQEDFARRSNARAVYTPQFALNGREYRYRQLWFDNIDADLRRVNGTAPRADIALRLEHDAKQLQVSGSASTRQNAANAGLFVALYENNLRTDVRAGENKGATLQHSFVVHRLIGPLTFDNGGKLRIAESLKLDPQWKLADLGVAAFVQERQGTDVWQALALAVCP